MSGKSSVYCHHHVYNADLVDLLRHRKQYQPGDIAFTFLLNGEAAARDLTYRDLDQQARAIAATLQHLKASRERALLLYQPGLEFIAAFFGCLYAGVIAVPVYPPRRNHHSHRLHTIVTDAQATLVLTTTSVLSTFEHSLQSDPAFTALHWLTTDNIDSHKADDWQPLLIQADTLALLQYTSGSTGAPKGVMLSHGNLLHNLAVINQCFEDTPNSRGVSWLPPYHDMGLIGGILQPIYVGAPMILMPPVAFFQQPIRWLQAISNYRVTTSGGPNFAYDLCVDTIKPDQLARLNLSHWQVAFTGAEPVRAQTLERFAHTFADCGFRQQAFYPCYGMAEATLLVSGGLKTDLPVIEWIQGTELLQNRVISAVNFTANSQAIIGCGRSGLDQKIVIAHPDSHTTCTDGEVGEIWVSGPSVAQGYWQQPEQTQQTFHAFLADTGEGPFLRTGDLGFLQAGELFVTGRIKDVIIIRGQNHYPQDIELTVQKSHPALRTDSGAAFAIAGEPQEQLVIVQEVKRSHLRNLEVPTVVEAITQAVIARHGLSIEAIALVK
ncbi:MAG: fatty acyl-AMP ligase, partial [Cyanothece sp. SIO1E1]|nr:fatty acyl-AMP ligase [Cyanothece sp. SIO1E1]